METLYSLINIAILICGMLLGYGFHKLFKMWLIVLIDHKIKVHNESIYTVINACEKVVAQSQKVNDSAKEYVEKSSIQVKKMEELCEASIALGKEYQKSNK